MFISVCAFSLMDVIVKWSDEYPVGEVLFFRGFFGIIPLLFLIPKNRYFNFYKTNRPFLHLKRCLAGLIAMILYFSALSRIPIGQAVTLQYTAPLFVALLSGSIIREQVSKPVLLLLITSFFGIILVVSPGTGNLEPDALLALGSGFFAAIAYIYVRKLRHTDSPSSVVFWFATFSVIGSIIQAAPNLLSLSVETIAALIGIGIGAGGGQVGITMAYHKANAAWVSAFSYLTVIVATFYGYIIFDESLTNTNLFVGILIIASGISLALLPPPNKK